MELVSCFALSSIDSESATDVSTSVAQKAIQAIGIIAIQLPPQANMCVDKLLALLVMEIDHITSEVMVTMTSESFIAVALCACAVAPSLSSLPSLPPSLLQQTFCGSMRTPMRSFFLASSTHMMS